MQNITIVTQPLTKGLQKLRNCDKTRLLCSSWAMASKKQHRGPNYTTPSTFAKDSRNQEPTRSSSAALRRVQNHERTAISAKTNNSTENATNVQTASMSCIVEHKNLGVPENKKRNENSTNDKNIQNIANPHRAHSYTNVILLASKKPQQNASQRLITNCEWIVQSWMEFQNACKACAADIGPSEIICGLFHN